MAVKSQEINKIDAEPKDPPSKPSSRKDMTKVIIRRLPPTMTESDLLEQISPLPAYDYFLFVPADYSLAPWAFTRAYINFENIDDVLLFRDRFDGYVFVDNRGSEYPAIVEMAPCAKVPKKKPKRDVKCGSLEDDPEYKKFVEQLKNPEPVQLATIEQCLEEIDKKEKERKDTKGPPKIPTPLTEYIRQKKEEKVRRQQEKKQQREEEKRKRIEREKLEEKRRQQREQREKERQEREANKKEERYNVPPRFANKEESKNRDRDYEKRKDETGGASTKPKYGKKSSGWKGEKNYYDDYYESEKHQDEGADYREPAKKPKAPKSYQSSSRFLDKENMSKLEKTRKSSVEYEEGGAGAGTGTEGASGQGQGTKEDRGKAEERKVNKERPPRKYDGASGEQGERHHKARYKDRPSVPLYQPGRKKNEDRDRASDQ